MASFYVLTPPVTRNPEKDTLFVRDGFSWLAFLFPVPWLLFRGMWMVAGLAMVAYLVAAIAAQQWGLDGLPVAFSFILSLWTSLEGSHVRARMLERKGWALKAEIAAHDLEDAEEIYFSDAPTSTTTSPAAGSKHQTSWPAQGTMALGLIGPYGDR